MTRYRKKPVVVEAMRCGRSTTPEEVARWCSGRVGTHPEQNYTGGAICVFIETLEGEMRADPGDWVIKGVKGEFYPCKPDIFDATYEQVEPDEGAAS